MKLTVRCLPIAVILIAISLFLILLFFLRRGNERERETDIFFNMEWVSFYGTKDSKMWISDSAVDNAAKKILKIKPIAHVNIRKKEMFPFSILFVSSEKNEKIVLLNTRFFTFDKKTIFPHNLTGEEMEAFYRAVHQ